ncbi:MAG: hypothetical protein ACRD5M_12090 [Candidatus Acidiferrales bacterium]
MKNAIKNSDRVLLPAKSRVIEFPQSTETSQSECVIELRLQDLSEFVANLMDSGFGMLLSEDIETREAFEELRVKEIALRWIVRVAKHSTGAVREKLWLDIEDAVSGLEKTSEMLLHAEIAWTRSIASDHRGGLAGPVRI